MDETSELVYGYEHAKLVAVVRAYTLIKECISTEEKSRVSVVMNKTRITSDLWLKRAFSRLDEGPVWVFLDIN